MTLSACLEAKPCEPVRVGLMAKPATPPPPPQARLEGKACPGRLGLRGSTCGPRQARFEGETPVDPVRVGLRAKHLYGAP